MGHRVGMTTDEATRRAHWERKYSTLKNWTIISTHSTKTAAQAAETAKKKAHRCDAGSGGNGNEHDNWKVYHFDF